MEPDAGLTEPTGTWYNGIAETMHIDRRISERLAETLNIDSRDCWRCAWVCLRALPLHGALYVEGWAVATGLLIEHAWIEVRDCIVDPALWDREVRYFPGLRFDRRAVRRELARKTPGVKAGGLPLAWRYGWRGTGSPAYMVAYRAALAYAAGVDHLPQDPGEECIGS